MAETAPKATIVDAIIQVLRGRREPMTVSEIYQAIVADKLYTFNARNPAGIVGTQLRRHAEGNESQAAARTKLFGRTSDGKYRLLDQDARNR